VIEVDCLREGRRWERVPSGPFPITKEQFFECRRLLEEQKKKWIEEDPNNPYNYSGMNMTTAREILKEVCPNLCSFDLLCLGNAVAMTKVKVTEV